jgi:hypothetical protein
MTPQVFIRRDTASEICDVVVLVRGQEMILRCPNYSQALKWARLECKSYKIPQPDIEPLTGWTTTKMTGWTTTKNCRYCCALPEQWIDAAANGFSPAGKHQPVFLTASASMA